MAYVASARLGASRWARIEPNGSLQENWPHHLRHRLKLDFGRFLACQHCFYLRCGKEKRCAQRRKQVRPVPSSIFEMESFPDVFPVGFVFTTGVAKAISNNNNRPLPQHLACFRSVQRFARTFRLFSACSDISQI